MQDLISTTLRRPPTHAPRAVGQGKPTDPRTGNPWASGRIVYQPPQLLAKYERAKVAGGLLFAVIFAGWLWLQWSNPWMRYATLGLLGLTAWITASTVLDDLRRQAGRQIELAGQALLITTPEGTCWVQLDDVDHAVWSDEDGMRFVRADGQSLGGIDLMQLADEDEARRFLGWLRQHASAGFNVRWPQRA